MKNLAFTPIEMQALFLSLKVSTSAIILTLAPAIFLAYVFARKNFLGKNVLLLFCQLPLVLPPVVLGYTLLLLLGRESVIGSFLYGYFGYSFIFHSSGAVLACSVVAFPLVLRVCQSVFEMQDRKQIEVAKTLGASSYKIFFKITLPQILPGILAGALLGWSRSLGEFGATISFVANIPGKTQTLPLAIYTQLQLPQEASDWSVLRLCTLSIFLAIFSLWMSEYWQKRIKEKLITNL